MFISKKTEINYSLTILPGKLFFRTVDNIASALFLFLNIPTCNVYSFWPMFFTIGLIAEPDSTIISLATFACSAEAYEPI